MPLSKDIKTMLATLRAGGDIAPVITCLEKWDKVHDKFYEDCKKPTPLRIRKECPCFKAEVEDDHLDISFRHYPRVCNHCAEEGYHDEAQCGWQDKYGCERVDIDPFEEAMEEAAEYEETFGGHRKR